MMEQTWRWFGPQDRVTLSDVRQTGAEGIVTALHDIPIGTPWTKEQIQERQRMIEAEGMRWSVVESLDVSERIKLREVGANEDIDNYIVSLRNLAACGIQVVAYNLMPVLTWLRTDLEYPLPTHATTTRYNATAMAAFDLFILRRHGAEDEWPEHRKRAAHTFFHSISSCEQDRLKAIILQGLPGGDRSFTMKELQRAIDAYRGLDVATFRSNVAEFLRAVCPVAQELGVRLCVHPDDPPVSVLGLPRIVSTAEDLAFLMQQSPEPSNGITFCTGALGVRADNDLLSMARQFGERIGFVHLRSTQREEDPASFFEASHLEGDADLLAIMIELVRQQKERRAHGDMTMLPFRADHGQQLLNDKDRQAQPGYPAIGRLRGLAELRGAMRAAERLLAD